MKFNVVFVNEGNLAKVGEEKGKNSKHKCLRYDLPRNTDRAQHVLNLHKSLCTIGFSILDSPDHFTLRLRPVADTDLDNFPVYLEEDGLAIDSQISELFNILPKPLKRKGFLLELILLPDIRAKRFIEIFLDKSIPALRLKETTFSLASQTKDPKFAKKFVKEGGIKILISLLDVAKGNTIAHIIHALKASLQDNDKGLQALLKNDGVQKLFTIMESPILSVAQRAVEILHYICYVDDNWEIIHAAASTNENQGFCALFTTLESSDLQTRLDALRIVNQLLSGAPSPEKKKEILTIIEENNALLSLQKSLGVTIPEMVKALRRFEVLSGIILAKVGGAAAQLKLRVTELEEEVKSLQVQRALIDSAELSELSEATSDSEDSIDYPDSILTSAEFAELEQRTKETDELRREIARLKEESEFVSETDVKSLSEDISHMTSENDVIKDKIKSLTDLVQNLIKYDTPPIFTCKRCADESDILFRLDRENQVRSSTVITRLQEPKPSGNSMNEQSAELTKVNMELMQAVEELKQQKYSIELDKKQLDSEVKRLRDEYNTLKEKKKKLYHSVHDLSNTRAKLIKECESTKSTAQELQEQIDVLTGESDVLQKLYDNEELVFDNDDIASLQQSVSRLKLMITTLSKQKHDLELRISSSTSE